MLKYHLFYAHYKFSNSDYMMGIQLSGRAIGCSPIGPWFKSVCPLNNFVAFCPLHSEGLYSSVAERWSCKPKVMSSILIGGILFVHVAPSKNVFIWIAVLVCVCQFSCKFVRFWQPDSYDVRVIVYQARVVKYQPVTQVRDFRTSISKHFTSKTFITFYFSNLLVVSLF